MHHIAGRCLFDHNPSPQRCARMGGVWDDSASVLGSNGGECVTEAQAQLRYDAAVGALELDVVQLSNDGGLVGFGERGAHSTIRRACSLLSAGAPSPMHISWAVPYWR